MSRDHAWNIIVNELRDQKFAPGTRSCYRVADAVVNALTAAGFNLEGDDFRDAPCQVHNIRRCAICVPA